MLNTIPRQELDRMFFNVLAALYHFERRKMALFGVNFEAFYLLYFLRQRSSARMSEIAEELNIHISTASRAVERLEKRKFLSRKKDPRDKRNILVSLEPEGEAVIKASEDRTFVDFSKNVEKFTDEELQGFMNTAINMNQILNGSNE